MATNEILPFANSGSANVMTQVDYAADTQLPLGNQPGIARSDFVNKCLRQVSIVASGLATYLAARQSTNITDSLTPSDMSDCIIGAVGGDVQKGYFNTAAAGGTANAITASYTPAVAALVNGMTLFVKAASANTSPTPTFTPNSGTVTAKTIVKGNNLPLAYNDIAGSGHRLILQYDSTSDVWVLLNPANGINSRIQLSANATFYVSTTGSDSDNGLTAGTPFLTIQKAWNTVKNGYDLNGYTVTVQLADGTYTAGMTGAGKLIGSATPSSFVIQGNTSTPSNVIVSTTSAAGFTAQNGAQFTVQYLKHQSTTSGTSLVSNGAGSEIYFNNLVFGAVPSANSNHLSAQYAGQITCNGNYSITGGAYAHWSVANEGIIYCASTVTLTGTPAFNSAFASSTMLSSIQCTGTVFSGSATGTRYGVSMNAVVQTGGGGASFLPGSVAGSTATGGQYA